MNQRRQLIKSALYATVLATGPLWSGLAKAKQASDWPSRPIRLVVPYAAGGLTDNLGRLIAERLRGMAPEGVVVENRPGAGTLLGGQQVAASAPDGHTLMVATSTTLGISQGLFQKPLVNIGDLQGIAMLGAVTLFLIVRPDFPATTVPELISALKEKPDHYTFASPGNGTPHHLLSEMLKNLADVSALHVPYNGSAAALTDLIAGRVDILILDATVVLPQVKAGKVRILATTAPKRSSLAPDVPTLKEFFPEMDLEVWQGVVGPNGIPSTVVSQLNKEINATLADPEFQARLVSMGLEPMPMSVEAFNEMIEQSAPRWKELVQRSGAKVD